jgi:toxin YoeB
LQTQFVLEWTYEALDQLDVLKSSKSILVQKYLTKLSIVFESIQSNPFKGIGKPEPLQYNYTSCWSRRINKKDRIIYKVEGKSVIIISIVGHYK